MLPQIELNPNPNTLTYIQPDVIVHLHVVICVPNGDRFAEEKLRLLRQVVIALDVILLPKLFEAHAIIIGNQYNR